MIDPTYKNTAAIHLQAINFILLSGGSGKRLWPLSNDVRSKQFLQLFKNDSGDFESMLQRTYRMLNTADEKANVVIATGRNQIPSIHTQIGNDVDVCAEPSRRNTFPAIALAVAYLHDVKGVDTESVAVVCPVDSYVEEDYFKILKKVGKQAQKDDSNLVLMGITPTYPSAKYGYIFPRTGEDLSDVYKFIEKPDEDTAAGYISEGALWNSGVVAFKLKYILDLVKKMYGHCSYRWIYDNYDVLEDTSFDYAVLEKEKSIKLIRFSGKWKDLGTWNTLTESMSEKVSGNATAVDCKNTHVINELSVPLLVLGTSDLAIAATPDGILVADKNSCSQMKDYIKDVRPMYEQRTWGEYKVIDFNSTTPRFK